MTEKITSIKFNKDELYNKEQTIQKPQEGEENSIFDHIENNLKWVGDGVEDEVKYEDIESFLSHIDTNQDGEFILKEAEDWLAANEKVRNNHREKFGDANSVLEMLGNFASSILGVSKVNGGFTPKTLNDGDIYNIYEKADIGNWSDFVDSNAIEAKKIDDGRTTVVTYENGTKAEFYGNSKIPSVIYPPENIDEKQVLETRTIDGGKTRLVRYSDDSSAEFTKDSTGNWKETPTREYTNIEKEEFSSDGNRKTVTYKDGSIAIFKKNENGEWCGTPTTIYPAKENEE